MARGGGGYTSEFLVGVCCPVPQILTQFQTKIFHFPHPFSDLCWILLFLYYSFGVEKTNTFIRSRGSLVNHTRFKTIMVKIYTRFQTKTAQKPYPLGLHIPIYSLYRGVSPPPPPGFSAILANFVRQIKCNIFIY